MNVWTYWKCPSCGAIVRGDNRDCPNCATPVPAGTKYLMPDNPEVERAIKNGTVYITSHDKVQQGQAVTQVSEDKVSKEANWICDYCGYQNRAENTVCEGCGAPKEESKTVETPAISFPYTAKGRYVVFGGHDSWSKANPASMSTLQ